MSGTSLNGLSAKYAYNALNTAYLWHFPINYKTIEDVYYLK